MQTIRKINEDLAIAGQIDLAQLALIAEEGYQSVLNLRSPQETGFLGEEQQKVELLGLQYVNLPFDLELISDQSANRVLQQIHRLPKPILVHCDTAIRSAAIALIHIATRQGATLEQAFKQAKNLGLFGVLTQA